MLLLMTMKAANTLMLVMKMTMVVTMILLLPMKTEESNGNNCATDASSQAGPVVDHNEGGLAIIIQLGHCGHFSRHIISLRDGIVP